MELMQKIALVFTVIGAINWGLIGLLDVNLVTLITGDMTMLTNLIYIIVGIAGLINIGIFFEHFRHEAHTSK